MLPWRGAPWRGASHFGSGRIVFNEFGAPALGHDGSNGSWYCSAAVYPGRGFAMLAVTNIGADVNGNGGAAVGDVISLLKNRHLEEIPEPVPSPCDDPQIQLLRQSKLRDQSPLSAEDKRTLAQYNRTVRSQTDLRECRLAVWERGERP